jgi:HSP20 family protein
MAERAEKAPEARAPEMQNIDQTIAGVERLYRRITGRDAPEASAGAYAPIPPEADAGKHVEAQLERLVATLGHEPGNGGGPSWAPRCTLLDNGTELVCRADLPGVDQTHVKVSIQPGALEIDGVRTPPEGGWNQRAAETPCGPFRRVVPLPVFAVVDKAAATLRDGVLEVRVPIGNRASQSRSLRIG